MIAGGVFTFAGLVNACLYCFFAWRADFPPPHTGGRAFGMLLLLLGNVVLAVVSVFGSIVILVTWHRD